MTLRHIESGDSFPERHVADLDDLKLADDDGSASDSVASSRRAPSRPPKARSESPDGYEMRGRYWEAADILKFDLEESKKAPDVWDYVYDPVCLPPSGVARTPTMRQLGAMPIRRAWRRCSSRERPNMRQGHVIEAIMVYERGEVLDRVGRCKRCSEGKGISRSCVVVPRIIGDACSNCLYDGLGEGCDALQRCSYRLPNRKRGRSDESEDNTVPRKEDFTTVLKLIEQMKNTSGASGSKKDQNVIAKAKRIEEAALQVARAAREWGRKEAPSK